MKTDNRKVLEDVYFERLQETSGILRAIDNEQRQRIIRLLSEDAELTVTDLTERLRITQALTSSHLATLKKAKLVSAKSVGRFIYYEVNSQKLEVLNRFVGCLLDENAESVRA